MVKEFIEEKVKEIKTLGSSVYEIIDSMGGILVVMDDVTADFPIKVKRYKSGKFALVVPNQPTEKKARVIACHALGHYVLGHAGTSKVEGYAEEWVDHRASKNEMEVFVFIKEYLLPAEKLKQAAEMMKLNNSKKLEGYLDLIEPLAETFGVDTAVMEDRLKEVGLI